MTPRRRQIKMRTTTAPVILTPEILRAAVDAATGVGRPTPVPRDTVSAVPRLLHRPRSRP